MRKPEKIIPIILAAGSSPNLPFAPKGVRVVINRKWPQGQLSSLLAALRKVSDAAFLIYPVDHVLLKRNTVVQLVRAFHSRLGSQEIVMPRYKGADGHPVIVSAAVRPEFFEAQTAREVIYQIPQRIRVVNVGTTSI